MSARWFAVSADRGGLGGPHPPHERTTPVSESGSTQEAGEGLSDREMVETVAGQTDSASENAQTAGKDWDGDASQTPDPNAPPA